MHGTDTFTIEPTPAAMAEGLMHYAHLLAALVLLGGLLFGSWALGEDDDKEDSSWSTA